MSAGDLERAQTRVRDGVAWQIGTNADVSWIADGTVTGLSITSAIPPVFDDYATVVLPCESRIPLVGEHDQAVLKLLERHTLAQPWWLGYLETGGSDIVFHDARKVTLHGGWSYVLVQAGPEQAATWRRADNLDKNTALPDLIFPRDRSWLLSTLWDDDWTCIGGPQALIADLLTDGLLGRRARRVTVDQDATPPGHVAI